MLKKGRRRDPTDLLHFPERNRGLPLTVLSFMNEHRGAFADLRRQLDAYDVEPGAVNRICQLLAKRFAVERHQGGVVHYSRRGFSIVFSREGDKPFFEVKKN